MKKLQTSDITLNGNFTPNIYNALSDFGFKNCTGTISGNFYVQISTNKKYMFIFGRIRIASFVRSGANLGVTAILPFTAPKTTSKQIGICAERPAENLMFIMTAGSNAVRIETTETYANATGSTLTFMCPECYLPL